MKSTPSGPGDETGLAAIPFRSTTLYVIIASSLVGIMGVSLISPVMPYLRPVFQISDTEASLMLTVYTLPGVFLTPFVGLVADRFGRKPVLVPLLFLFGLTGSAIAFTTDFRYVLALRFFQGIGASALVTLAVTLIGDVYTGTRRDAVMGREYGTLERFQLKADRFRDERQ